MAYLNITEVLELKKAVEERFDIILHFHDACGGQHFSAESPLSDKSKEFITDYFKNKRLTAVFSEKQNSFIIK